MNDSQTYVDERDLVIFYQILSTTPQLGAVLYRQELGEAVRAWLNDIWTDAPVREQRWLEALYLYYGLVDGEPKEYREVALHLARSLSTVRDRAARGLRYLWEITHVRNGPKPELLEAALKVNEWPTDDPSQEVSLTFFEILMNADGVIVSSGKTPTADDLEDQATPTRPNMNGADVREPNLWNPEWRGAETAPERVIFSRRGDLTKGGVRA
jgi:hypothetical protein